MPDIALRAKFGGNAVDAGTPDRGMNDDATDLVDTLANMMHWARGENVDFHDALETAAGHYEFEQANPDE